MNRNEPPAKLQDSDGIQKDGYGLTIEGEKTDSEPVKKDEYGNVIEDPDTKPLLDEKQKSQGIS